MQVDIGIRTLRHLRAKASVYMPSFLHLRALVFPAEEDAVTGKESSRGRLVSGRQPPEVRFLVCDCTGRVLPGSRFRCQGKKRGMEGLLIEVLPAYVLLCKAL